MSIGNNLKRLREKNGFSQELIAEKIGVSRQAVSKWENDTSNPSTENLIKISKLFEVDVDVLTNGDVTSEKSETNKSIRYFKSYEDKMRVLSYLSRLGIIITFTGYYGYYTPSSDAPLFHWVVLFLASCGLLFYCNKEYYNVKNANKILHLWDSALTFIVVFVPRILRFSMSWNLIIMNILSIIAMLFIMDLIRKRWVL